MFAECLAALKEHVCCVILHSFYCDIWSEESAGWFVQETDIHTIWDSQYELLLYCCYIENNILNALFWKAASLRGQKSCLTEDSEGGELISCGTFNL